MAMVCPRCQGVFQQLWNCPSCKVRLGYQGAARVPLAADDDTAGQWQQTPWGRIAIGVVLAQGLYYGLRQLLVAGLMASGDEAAGAVWPTLTGLLVLQGVQAAGLIVAGLFAGAGQRQGIVFGVVVGVWNGVLTVLIQSLSGPHTTVTLLGQPILHTALGALGGFIGGSIWRAPQSLVVPVLAGAKGPERAKGTRVRAALFAGPIAWTRVFAGTALAVGGTLWAHVILELVMEASDGTLSIDNHLQAQLVTWEVTALAMLAGAAVAMAKPFDVEQVLAAVVTHCRDHLR